MATSTLARIWWFSMLFVRLLLCVHLVLDWAVTALLLFQICHQGTVPDLAVLLSAVSGPDISSRLLRALLVASTVRDAIWLWSLLSGDAALEHSQPCTLDATVAASPFKFKFEYSTPAPRPDALSASAGSTSWLQCTGRHRPGARRPAAPAVLAPHAGGIAAAAVQPYGYAVRLAQAGGNPYLPVGLQVRMRAIRAGVTSLAPTHMPHRPPPTKRVADLEFWRGA